MGYLGRRIGKSQNQGDSSPEAANGAVGGGILDLFAHGYFERQGDIYNAPSVLPSGITATGGIISDYSTPPGAVYRAHIFTTSGAFDVASLSTNASLPDTVDYLVVAGGGGGGRGTGGGGGAGGFRTNMPGTPHSTPSAFPISVSTYPVIVGSGGAGGVGNELANGSDGMQGGNSSFGPPSDPARIISTGGGLGRGYNSSSNPQHPTGGAGGSGGGAGRGGQPYTSTGSGGPTSSITGLPVSPTTQGKAGGTGGSNGNPVGNSNHSYGGGGGGGAGAVGGNASLPNAAPAVVGGAGGAGLQLLIGGPATSTGIGALNPGPGEYGWFAGGGSGGSSKQGNANGTEVAGGVGGGGKGQKSDSNNTGIDGQSGTGGGGGGQANPSTPQAGSGGSGVVIIRYKIASTPVQKATGGAISYYDNKTIHTFTGSGTFATTSNWSAATVEYAVIGGGGGGGRDDGGGGGAGAVKIGSTPIGAHPVSTVIQVGSGGEQFAAGTPSYFGSPITAPGGGAGGCETPAPTNGGGGGSGGGGAGGFGAGSAGTGSGDDFPGSSPFVSPPNGWGNDGGSGGPGGGANYSGGGGGGASEVGASTPVGNYGGRGMQLSPTFRDPSQSIGAPGEVGYGAPQPGQYFAAGGGGTRTTGNGTGVGYGMGGIGGGGWGGSNTSAPNSPFSPPGSGTHGESNTGSGGGGGDLNNDAKSRGGYGGSGIVLIAYPS